MSFSLIFPAVTFVLGLAIGYWIGWNRSAHPGKVESELSSAFDKAKADAKKL